MVVGPPRLVLIWHNVNVRKKGSVFKQILKWIMAIWLFLKNILRCRPYQPLQEHDAQQNDSSLLLRNVFGRAISGELTAIMGASGAGKSTLLNFLSKRKMCSFDVKSGKMKLDGAYMKDSEIRSLAAYVQQDVVFEDSQTVMEHMKFVANLLLANSHSSDERKEKITQLLDKFHLNQRDAISDLSGGEKKRLAVASALLNDPPILFCDEPTSGLDSDKADKMVQFLKKTAEDRNMIIVITIHQPSCTAYNEFDKIYLLGSGGRICFSGTRDQAIEFFNIVNDAHPAEFFIKKLAQDENEKKEVFQTRIEGEANLFRKHAIGISLMRECGQKDDLINSQQQSTSSTSNSNSNESERIFENPQTQPKFANFSCISSLLCIISFFRQICSILKRSFKMLTKIQKDFLLIIMAASSVIVPAFLGLTSWQEPINQDTVMNFNGRLNLCISAMNMYQFITVNMVCQNLPIYLQEYSSNLYGPISFFIARNIFDVCLIIYFLIKIFQYFHLLYSQLVNVFLHLYFTFLVNFLNKSDIKFTEQPLNLNEFLVFFLCCAAVANAATSLGYLFAFVTFSAELATMLIPIIMLPLLTFNGFYLNRGTFHNPIFRFVDWISYFSNAFEIMAINKWHKVGNITGCVYEWDPSINLDNEFSFGIGNEGTSIVAAIPKHCYRDGKDVLDSLDFHKENLFEDWCILLGFLIVTRILAFIAFMINSWRLK